MQIKNQYPPNIDLILASGLKPNEQTRYCYGDTIYNPSGKELTPDIELHESIHAKQQGDNPDQWWYNYLTDKNFRLEQELEAYAHQLNFIKEHIKDKELFKWGKDKMVEALSDGSYNLGLSFGEAESKLRNKAKQLKNSMV